MIKSLKSLYKPLKIKCWFNTIFFVLFINFNLFSQLLSKSSFIQNLINIDGNFQSHGFLLKPRINLLRSIIKNHELLNFILQSDESKLITELKLPKNQNCSYLPFFELFIVNFFKKFNTFKFNNFS